jgi:hypothetical protein
VCFILRLIAQKLPAKTVLGAEQQKRRKLAGDRWQLMKLSQQTFALPWGIPYQAVNHSKKRQAKLSPQTRTLFEQQRLWLGSGGRD